MKKLFLFCLLLLTYINHLFAQIQNETFYKTYTGTIGRHPITMHMCNIFGSITGHYYYGKKKHNTLALNGNKIGTSIIISNFNDRSMADTIAEANETFRGNYLNDSTIIGTWESSGKKKLQFILNEQIDTTTLRDKNIQLAELAKYIKQNPYESGFFINPAIQNELKLILQNDFNNYLEFLMNAGLYPEFHVTDNILWNDFSYSHIGCMMQSYLAVDIATHKFYICWIKDNPDDLTIYHNNNEQIPTKILDHFCGMLNKGWGHVYTFTVSGQTIKNTSKQ